MKNNVFFIGVVMFAVVFSAMAYLSIYDEPHPTSQVAIIPTQVTPGVINPDVTQANIQQTICVAGWTATIRPPSSYTTNLKIEQIKQYGYTDTKTEDYEEDHLISLELGGNPTDTRNLWPESYASADGTGGAKSKDAVENYLHREVCAVRLELQEAQKEISTDWYAVYTAHLKGKLGASNLDTDDE